MIKLNVFFCLCVRADKVLWGQTPFVHSCESIFKQLDPSGFRQNVAEKADELVPLFTSTPV